MEPCANLCLWSSLVILGFVFSRIKKERRRSTGGTFQRRPLRGCDLTIAYLYIKISIHQVTLVAVRFDSWICIFENPKGAAEHKGEKPAETPSGVRWTDRIFIYLRIDPPWTLVCHNELPSEISWVRRKALNALPPKAPSDSVKAPLSGHGG